MSQLKVWNGTAWIPAVVGAVGQTGPQGPAGQGVPTGGTTGQALVKKSGNPYDTEWQAITTGVSSVDGLTGTVSLTDNYDAKGTAALKSKFDAFLAKANGPLKAFPAVVTPTGYTAYSTATNPLPAATFYAWDSPKFYYRGLVSSTVTISGTSYVRNDPLNNLSYNPYWIEFDHYGQYLYLQYAAATSKRLIWVWVDGSPVALTSSGIAGSNGQPYYYYINFGAVAQRRVRILMGSADFAGIGLASDTDTIFPVEQKLLKVVLFGGSWFAGGSGGVSNLSEQLSIQLGEMLNVDYYVLAIGGTGYVNGNNPNPPYDPVLGYNVAPNNTNGPSWVDASRLSPLVTIQPDLVVFLGTTNDDTFTGSQYRLGDHATYVYDYIKNNLSKCKIVSFARQSNGQTSAAIAANALAVYNAASAHSSVIGAVNDYDEGWITGSVTDSGSTGNASVFIYNDQHPTAAGNRYYASRMFNRISDFVKTYTRS